MARIGDVRSTLIVVDAEPPAPDAFTRWVPLTIPSSDTDHTPQESVVTVVAELSIVTVTFVLAGPVPINGRPLVRPAIPGDTMVIASVVAPSLTLTTSTASPTVAVIRSAPDGSVITSDHEPSAAALTEPRTPEPEDSDTSDPGIAQPTTRVMPRTVDPFVGRAIRTTSETAEIVTSRMTMDSLPARSS